MSTPIELELVAALLRQGRSLNALSRLLILLAGGWLTLMAAGLAAPQTASLAALFASLLLGLAQLYFALRVGLDAELLRALAQDARARGGDLGPSTTALDDALRAQALQPADRPARDWTQRLAGARRLWRGQILALLLQLLLFAGALLLALLQAPGAGFGS